jgi:hypothetical protein
MTVSLPIEPILGTEEGQLWGMGLNRSRGNW